MSGRPAPTPSRTGSGTRRAAFRVRPRVAVQGVSVLGVTVPGVTVRGVTGPGVVVLGVTLLGVAIAAGPGASPAAAGLPEEAVAAQVPAGSKPPAGWVATRVPIAGAAAGEPSHRAAQPTLRITNLVPAFLAFHESALDAEDAARAEAADAGREPDGGLLAQHRLALWQEHLPEAGVLLDPDADEGWAPDRLEGAWPRYSGALDRIRGFEGGLSPDPAGVLREVGGLLQLDRPLEVHLVLYVGTFDDEPAFRLQDGEYTVLLPVEALPGARRPLLIDLFTRAVHARLAGRPPPGRELSLGEQLVIRGLALRVYEELNPGRPAQEYLLRSQDWLIQAERRDGDILDWVRPRIAVRDPGQLALLMERDGVTGMAGEFDYAAWRVSGLFLVHGWTLHRLAREPVGDLDRLVREVLGA